MTGTNATATFDNVTVTEANRRRHRRVERAADRVADRARRTARRLTAPATITLTASAADSDGTIAKVDFYAGSTLLGTATTAPYSVAWNDVGAGTYSLTAVATDNAGATTTSAAVSVTVSESAAAAATTAAGSAGGLGARRHRRHAVRR